MPILSFRSDDALVAWPAVTNRVGSYFAALQYQLELSQWWTPDQLLARQFAQLERLASHAFRTVPFQQERLLAAGYQPDVPLSPDVWARIPVLTRQTVQQAGAHLRSREVPGHHGKSFETSSSGSTGMPVTVVKTGQANSVWQAITLRDHLWHRRDLALKLCAIRDAEAIFGIGKGHMAAFPKGASWATWGGAAAHIFATGASSSLHIHTPVEQQAEWLQRERPAYLVTFPSNLASLVKYCEAQSIYFPDLHGLSTLGEVVTDELRDATRNAWGLELKDIYSSAETGYIALQCPEHDHYHLQSEAALVEILDTENRPCRPGEVGRVVVTPLHNFATPLLRYAIGDYAEVGETCPCGRGLPVLRRVLGRTRNMLTFPDGRQIWPELEGATFAEVAPVTQFQVIQKSRSALEVRLVPARTLTGGEEDGLRAMIRQRLGYDFAIEFTYHAAIERSRSGKYEDFKSEIAG